MLPSLLDQRWTAEENVPLRLHAWHGLAEAEDYTSVLAQIRTDSLNNRTVIVKQLLVLP